MSECFELSRDNHFFDMCQKMFVIDFLRKLVPLRKSLLIAAQTVENLLSRLQLLFHKQEVVGLNFSAACAVPCLGETDLSLLACWLHNYVTNHSSGQIIHCPTFFDYKNFDFG